MSMIRDFFVSNFDYLLFLLTGVALLAMMHRGKRNRLRTAGIDRAELGGDQLRMRNITLFRNVMLLVLVALGWFLVNEADRDAEERNKSVVEGIAPTFAFEMKQKGHQFVHAGTNLEDPTYVRLNYTVIKWMEINPDITNIYTIRKLSDGTATYVIAPEKERDRDPVGISKGASESRISIGRGDSSHDPDLERAFAGESVFQYEKASRGGGAFITTYVPIYDGSGKVDAVLGVDYDSSTWQENVRKARWNVLVSLILFLIPLNALYLIIFNVRVERYQMIRHQAQIAESEDRFRNLIDATFEGIVFVNRHKMIAGFNQSFGHMTGYAEEDLIGEQALHLIPADVRERYRGMLQPTSSFEAQIQCKDGTIISAEAVATSCMYNGEPGSMIAVRDISERKKAEETINYMAYHDPLTHLPNRALFHEHLHRTLGVAEAEGSSFAVLFLDLDRFKLVNDTLGHTMGDEMLKGVATRLSECAEGQGIVARMGGDEFTILLTDLAGADEVEALCRRIIASINEPFRIGDYELHTTTSIGISLYPQDGEDAQGLMKNADTAMYRAKEQGRNNYSFYLPAMNKRSIERLELENGLRYALERGELVVYYQPRLNISTGEIIGMEALVRWQHPQLGLVSPADFIPLAEETGLIVPIGDWVLRTACQQNKEWQEKGFPPMLVAVNLSARQFQRHSLIESIDRALEDSGLEPEHLELEITESITMQDVEFTIDTLRALSERGIQISIDDFGTGYSSLSYLKRFPIHTLKIDQSFVREITIDPYNAAIVTTVIYLAQNLKLKVIAEGVETEEQLHYLREHQCDEMQGFLFSRPVPAAEFEKLLGHRTGQER